MELAQPCLHELLPLERRLVEVENGFSFLALGLILALAAPAFAQQAPRRDAQAPPERPDLPLLMVQQDNLFLDLGLEFDQEG